MSLLALLLACNPDVAEARPPKPDVAMEAAKKEEPIYLAPSQLWEGTLGYRVRPDGKQGYMFSLSGDGGPWGHKEVEYVGGAATGDEQLGVVEFDRVRALADAGLPSGTFTTIDVVCSHEFAPFVATDVAQLRGAGTDEGREYDVKNKAGAVVGHVFRRDVSTALTYEDWVVNKDYARLPRKGPVTLSGARTRTLAQFVADAQALSAGEKWWSTSWRHAGLARTGFSFSQTSACVNDAETNFKQPVWVMPERIEKPTESTQPVPPT